MCEVYLLKESKEIIYFNKEITKLQDWCFISVKFHKILNVIFIKIYGYILCF